MNFRSTYVLLGLVIAALGGLAIYILVSGGDGGKSGLGEGFLMASLKGAGSKPTDIDTVEIELPGQTPEKIVFVRETKGWLMTTPGKARADAATLDGLVSGLLGAKIEKSADVTPNLAPHGLENPPVKITLRSKNTADWVALGNVTIGGSRAVVYVTTSDKPTKPQAVLKSDFQSLFKSDAPKTATHAGELVRSITEFRSLGQLADGLADPVVQVKSLRILKDKDELALFQAPGGVWKFRLPADFGDVATEADATPPKDGTEPPINNVRTLLNLLQAIKPGDTRQIIEQPKTLATYGLDTGKDKPLQIDLVRDDGSQETLYVGNPVAPAKADPKAEPADRYYARHAADSVVVEVNATAVRAVERLLKAKHLLRDRTVLRVSPALVDAIDVESNGDKFELRKLGAEWKLYDAEGNARTARPAAVQELLTRLTSRQLAKGFPDPTTPEEKRGFAKSTVEIKLWEVGIPRDPKIDTTKKPVVTNAPSVRLQFGFTELGDVFTRRTIGDSKTDYFLPQDAFALAARSRLEYLDAPMKPFGADSVLMLRFTRGKDVYEVTRPDDGKPTTQTTWTLKSPEAIKGRLADPFKVFELLNQLSFVRPVKVAADRPKDDLLNRLEVNPANPRLKVTAKVKDLGDRTYDFGGDVGVEKKNVYLKLLDENMIVEVERGVFDLFGKADVQDLIVHKIDKTKIKSLKLRGWQDVLGAPATLEIERKDGKWTLKTGGMFELDPAKVDLLLNDLTTPRAEAFLVFKTGPTAEHGLDVAKNALEVEMDVEGAGVTKMVLSTPNKDGKVNATTSALPGDVFTLADKFAALRAKPAALKKD